MSTPQKLKVMFQATWDNQSPAYLLCQTGEWLESKGKTDEALQHYEASIFLDRSLSIAFYRAGNLYLRTSQAIQAIEKLKRADILCPHHSPTMFSLAKAYSLHHQHQETILMCRKIIDNEPLHIGALTLMAQSFSFLGNWQAVSEVPHLLSEPRSDANEVYFLLAYANYKLGKYSEACQLYAGTSLKMRKRYQKETAELEKICITCLEKSE